VTLGLGHAAGVDASGEGEVGVVHELDEVTALARARVDAARAASQLPVVMLDVDSSLIDTAPRHLWILREWAFEQNDVELINLVRGLGSAAIGWSIEDVLKEHGLGGHLRDPAYARALRRFWARRFFSDEGCARDVPYAGAVGFVRTLHEAGALIVYLTARPARTMGAGTASSLLRWGFPVLTGRTMLHLKADADEQDIVFKEAALADLRALRGEVVVTMENEPANANLFAATFPRALHLLATTVHRPKPPPPSAALVPFTWPAQPAA
jgi:beta-phosphoglucomutase-like phosphatase (HAD superfamily)